MKTLAILLLAGTAAAQTATELDFGRPDRSAEKNRSAPQAPTLDLDGGEGLEAGSSLDFAGGSMGPSGKLDLLAAQQQGGPMLDASELGRKTFIPKAGFAGYDKTKRGFKKTEFSKNRVEYKGAGGRSVPAQQLAVVGETRLLSNGSKMTLLDYDASKPYGERHHWEVVSAGGEKSQFHSSPLVFDLNGDGVRMSRKSSRFDANGDLKKDTVNEISKDDGLLVFDADHDGTAGESGLEAFGTATDLDNDHKKDGYADGYEALWALARKAQAEGVLAGDALDDEVLDSQELARLAKAYGLGMRVGSVAHPAVSLEKAGVVSIHLTKEASQRAKDFDGQGNETTRRPGATFTGKDGKVLAYEDVWFEL